MYKILAAKAVVYKLTLYTLLTSIIVVSGCTTAKQVTRIDPDTEMDLSGRWNDTDSRLVAKEMIGDCLTHPWLNTHGMSTGKKPVVIVGNIRNKSMEHIAVGTFISDIERAFINTGKVQPVSSPKERDEIRGERTDQSEFAAMETIKQMGKELGADYMMTGEINTIEDREGGKQVVYYQTDLTLTNIQTNAKIWIGQKKIKKFIERNKLKW